MNTSHTQTTVPVSKKRRRFLIVPLVFIGVAALGPHLPIGGLSQSTAGASATGQISMLGGDARTSTIPSALTSTVYGLVGTAGKVVATSPSWSPMLDSAGEVTGAGDIAIVNTTSATSSLTVTLHVVNLAALAHDYSSFTLPVAVYYAADGSAGSAPTTSSCSNTGGCNWQLANGTAEAPSVANDASYLTNDGGSVTFQLPAGAYYEIAMPTGGSYYCVSTTTSYTASLSPEFFVSSASN